MIDYSLIYKSIEHYQSVGFVRVEVPWTVSEYIDNITKPKDMPSFKLNSTGKCLVASGEQSFLYQYLKGFLPKGRYQAVTPCFRYDEFDFTHTKYFIKNELINTKDVNNDQLDLIVNNAYNFFIKFFNENQTKLIEIVKTDCGFDIEYKGLELGSYGIRECDFLKWIYGTGCAEPRLSTIINLSNGIS